MALSDRGRRQADIVAWNEDDVGTFATMEGADGEPAAAPGRGRGGAEVLVGGDGPDRLIPVDIDVNSRLDSLAG